MKGTSSGVSTASLLWNLSVTRLHLSTGSTAQSDQDKMSVISITCFNFITCRRMMMMMMKNVADICIRNKQKLVAGNGVHCADCISMDLLLYWAFYLTKSSVFFPSVRRTSDCHWSPDTPRHLKLADIFIHLLNLLWLIITSLCDQWNWKQIIKKTPTLINSFL